MDYKIEKKKVTPKRIIIAIIIVVLFVALFFIIRGTWGNFGMSVDAERISIAEAKMDSFREFIPANGILQPITTIYLDMQEGGRIEERFVEDGAIMSQGQPILRLENSDLKLNLLNQETSVYNMLMQIQIAQNSARQNTIQKQTQVVDMENLLKEAKRVYDVNSKLYDKKIIPLQDYLESKNYYEYMLQKSGLVKRILIEDSIASSQQIAQQEQSYIGAKEALDLVRRKVVDLTVCAPVDGQLTSLDAEVGQNKNKGERIGQIDVLSGFKIRVEIDEHYISRIYTDLEAIYKRDEISYPLIIKKVYTQVSAGRFAVDMVFKEKVPEGIRQGQTLPVRIALGEETQALIIPRGSFYQKTGGNWIFKLTLDGQTAYKTCIRIGRQNPDYYEVLDGLQPGDKVIVNSYDNYGDAEELRVNR